MTEQTSWQKYETKSSKKKTTKPNVQANGDVKSAKQHQNGHVVSGGKAAPLVSNVFDDFIEGGDGMRKKDAKKVPPKGRNGISVISGEQILKKGSVTSKFGETISFITSSATEQAAKITGVAKPPPKKVPQVKSVSYAINFSVLKADVIQKEIDSLADVDQAKRCLSLAVFLNVQKAYQDVQGWETKSFESGEPLSNLPKDVEKVLKKFIQSVPESFAGASFELVLAELVSKSHSQATTWGYKVILQLLGRLQPEAAILKHHKNLSRLFANTISTKANVLSWALSQPVCVDPVMGLRIWCRVLLPLISNKSLAPAICTCLERLMSIEELLLGKQTLQHIDYFPLLDYTFPQPGLHNLIDAKTQKTLQVCYPKLKSMAAISLHATDFFSSFLMRYKQNQSSEMLEELMSCLVFCLRSNTKCYDMWLQMLESYSEQTRLFLADLADKWHESPDLPRKELNKFLDKVMKTVGDSDPEGIIDTVKQFKEHLSGKPARKKVTFGSKSSEECNGKQESGFFFKLFTLLLLIAVCASVEYSLRGQESMTKVALESSRKNMLQLHDWTVKKYPKETKYVKDGMNQAYRDISPKVNHAYNVAYAKIDGTLDYVYKDGPLRLYKYMKGEVFPPVEKYYIKNLEPSIRKVSGYIAEQTRWFLQTYNLENLLQLGAKRN